MRTLRLSLVGTVVLAVLGSTSAVALAQTDSETEGSDASAVLSFTAPYGTQTDLGTAVVDEGRSGYRDATYTVRFEANDPRISGELWSIHHWERHRDSQGATIVGLAGIDGEAGAWQGTFHGYASPGDKYLAYQLDLAGEGAYEGLSAMLFMTDNGASFDVEGMVFPGELPPPPELPAE